MIPQEVLVVPMFVMMWVNTFQSLIIPWAFTALGAFLLRQFFMGVPQELDDAARVDGAGTIKTFFMVMLPLAKPTLAVLAVFSFINYWNSFLWPLIVINDVNNLGTIPLGLQMFFGQQGSQWHLVMAASVISMAPTLVLLILLQKPHQGYRDHGNGRPLSGPGFQPVNFSDCQTRQDKTCHDNKGVFDDPARTLV